MEKKLRHSDDCGRDRVLYLLSLTRSRGDDGIFMCFFGLF